MSGRLTTHALDLVLGRGAAGLAVVVRRLEPDAIDLGRIVLDEGGRGVLAEGPAFTAGLYELIFAIGDYHRRAEIADAGAFLEAAPARFRVRDASLHTHVPILISLYGYSLYRGG